MMKTVVNKKKSRLVQNPGMGKVTLPLLHLLKSHVNARVLGVPGYACEFMGVHVCVLICMHVHALEYKDPRTVALVVI